MTLVVCPCQCSRAARQGLCRARRRSQSKVDEARLDLSANVDEEPRAIFRLRTVYTRKCLKINVTQNVRCNLIQLRCNVDQ